MTLYKRVDFGLCLLMFAMGLDLLKNFHHHHLHLLFVADVCDLLLCTVHSLTLTA